MDLRQLRRRSVSIGRRSRAMVEETSEAAAGGRRAAATGGWCRRLDVAGVEAWSLWLVSNLLLKQFSTHATGEKVVSESEARGEAWACCKSGNGIAYPADQEHLRIVSFAVIQVAPVVGPHRPWHSRSWRPLCAASGQISGPQRWFSGSVFLVKLPHSLAEAQEWNLFT